MNLNYNINRKNIYGLTVVNNSKKEVNACVFQLPFGDTSQKPIAWKVFQLFPSQESEYHFKFDFMVAWAETGSLKSGTTFIPAQITHVDPGSQSTLSNHNGQPKMSTNANGIVNGFGISFDNSIPKNKFSAGIGIDNQCTLIAQAKPNTSTEFTPIPCFFIMAGEYQEGQVLDIDLSKAQQVSSLLYFPIWNNLVATLHNRNNWDVSCS